MKKLLGFLALAPLALSHAEITRAQFDSLTQLCIPPKEDAAWLALGWETDLWAARTRAAMEGKPLFLWEMDGHPLGCT